MERFKDRTEAGRFLAARLDEYANRPDVLVLALPRGGVPVGFEVARALDAPLDVFVVRKLGVPGHEEYAMGAIASGGGILLNEQVVRAVGVCFMAFGIAAIVTPPEWGNVWLALGFGGLQVTFGAYIYKNHGG